VRWEVGWNRAVLYFIGLLAKKGMSCLLFQGLIKVLKMGEWSSVGGSAGVDLERRNLKETFGE
jgi:hypothetical protein